MRQSVLEQGLPLFMPDIDLKVFGTGGDYRKKAMEFARANLIGKSVRNAQTGAVIGFNKTGVEKSLTGPTRAAVFPHLLGLLQRAEYQWSNTARDKPNVRAYHRFTCWTRLNGKPTRVWLLVREDRNGLFHYHHMLETKNPPVKTVGAFQQRWTGAPPANP